MDDFYDGDLLNAIAENLEIGENKYDGQAVYKSILRILKRNQSPGILSRFDANSKQYVRGNTTTTIRASNESIYGNSEEGIAREGIPFGSEQRVRENDGLLTDADLEITDNDMYAKDEVFWQEKGRQRTEH